MKYIIIGFIFLSLAIIPCFAENLTEDMINEQIKSINLDSAAKKSGIQSESADIIPKIHMEDILKGNLDFDLKSISKNIFDFLLMELKVNIKIMLQIIVLSVITAVLTNLQSSFANKGIYEISFLGVYTLIATILLQSFIISLELGRGIIDVLSTFMQYLTPVLLGLLAATGGKASAAILQPSVLFILQIIVTIIKDIVIPMIIFGTILSIVNNFSEKFHIGKLAGLLKKGTGLILSISVTCFVGILSIQGVAGSISDSVLIRSGKFAVGSFVPVVGGALSESFTTVLYCSSVVKNTTGIFGIVTILTLCIAPVIKLAAINLIYNFTAALIEPIADSRITNILTEMANSIRHIIGILILVTIMFLMIITIIINIRLSFL